MKIVEWKTYRTRFRVKAKQLSSALTFVDHLGRQHIGRKGDYLVESSEGVLSIAPRQIFEDIYVSMSHLDEPQAIEIKTDSRTGEKNTARELHNLLIEPLDIEEVSFRRKPVANQQNVSTREHHRDEPVRVRRKQPQPCRDRRTPAQPSRLNLM
jgi:hypothetical protein